MNNIKVVICSGGTGGHLFPAQATVENLLEFNLNKNLAIPFNKVNKINCIKVIFFTDKRSLPFLKPLKNKISIKTICACQFFGKSKFYKLKSLFFMSVGFIQTLYSFLINRPSVVVSFGGYISVPILFAATILKIPIVLHEQNAILGNANKLFARFAKAIATNFKKTIGLDNHSHKVHYVGLPIRKDLVKFLHKNALNEHIFTNKKINLNSRNFSNHNENLSKSLTITILGGSQGATVFGPFIPKAFQKFPLDMQKNLKVYHQCREELLKNSLLEWNKTEINAVVKPFFYNIAQVLNESDLIIARSGASTIAEINCFGKAAIYIPFKKAILNHQMYNAIAMVNKGCAQIINEESLNFEYFNDIIISLLKKKSKIDNMANLSKKECKLNAGCLLSSLIINITK